VNAKKPRRVKNVRSPERIDLYGLITFWCVHKKRRLKIRLSLRHVKVQEPLQILEGNMTFVIFNDFRKNTQTFVKL
jgi:hypothetical protein